jgi:hypothetical protein
MHVHGQRFGLLTWGVLVAALLAPVASHGGLCAQASALGPAQNPPDVRWRAIESPAARILAPRELEAEAQRLAAVLSRIAAQDTATLKGRPRRIDVVLQQRLAEANGFVTLFPRRTEWFLQPPQGDGLQGPLDWLDLLAVHEYRHVKQFDALDRGVTRAFSRFLGDFAWGGFLSWTTPSWLLEGDAVASETSLSMGGRGRMPSFDAELRARLLEARDPGYWTMLHRSFGTYWPNHYVHGYTMVRDARVRFGGDVWANAMARSTRRSFNPWALSSALARETGVGVTGLHRESMAALAARVQHATAEPMTAAMRAGAVPRDWTDDEFPQWDGDSALIVVQQGLGVLPTFVRLVPGRESREVLHSPGPYAFGVPPATGGGQLAWVEQRFDPRWGYQSYNVIMRTATNARSAPEALGDTTRWTAVAVAPTGERMAVVEQGRDRASALLVLDSAGTVEHRRVVPDGDLLVTPRFTRDGRDVLVVRIRRGLGRRVERCPVTGAACVPVGGFMPDAVQAPSGDSATVFVSRPVRGRDEIVAWRDGQWWQVTRRAVGATNPVVSPDGTRLAFNDQTGTGKRAMVMTLEPTAWWPLDDTPFDSIGTAALSTLAAQEHGARPLDAPLDSAPPYPVRDYSPWRHAWNPYGVQVSLPPLSPTVGASVYSQDVLGTFGAALGAEWNLNEQQPGARLDISWAGRYPILDADVAVTGRRDVYPATSTSNGGARLGGEFTWHEVSTGLGVRVPLNLTRDLYRTFVTMQASVRETFVQQSTLPSWFVSNNGRVRPVTVALAAGRGYAWVRDLQPVWGQYLTVLSRRTPVGGDFRGFQHFVRGQVFVPGLRRHHGLRLDAAHEEQARRATATDSATYRFASLMPRARGYEAITAPRFTRFSAEYVLPLWYPDRNIFQTVHLRRIRATLFADQLMATRRVFAVTNAAPAVPQNVGLTQRSAGVEVWTDTRWWHQMMDIPLGVRWTRRFDAVGARASAVEFVVALGL